MKRPNHAQAPKGATGKGRNRRRPQGRRRLSWVRPFWRAQRALDACVGLIDSSLRTAAASERCADRRPIRASRDLHHASGRLIDASARLMRAARELAETNRCIARAPERAAFAPPFLTGATQRWMEVAARLQEVAGDVFVVHESVLSGLESDCMKPGVASSA